MNTQTQKLEETLSLKGSFEDLNDFKSSNNINLDINLIENYIRKIIHLSGLGNEISKLPINFNYYWGASTIDRIIFDIAKIKEDENIYILFNEFKTNKKYIKNDIIDSGKVKIFKTPYAFKLSIVNPDAENDNLAIESFSISASQPDFCSISTLIKSEFIKHKDYLLRNNKVTTIDINLFEQFIVQFYSAKAQLIIEKEIELLSNDENNSIHIGKIPDMDIMNKIISNQKNEVLPDNTDQSGNNLNISQNRESIIYNVEIALLFNNIKAIISTIIQSKSEYTFKAKLEQSISLNDIINDNIPGLVVDHLPTELKEKNEEFLEFEITFKDGGIIVWFKASSLKIGFRFKNNFFVYIGYEKSNDSSNNIIEEIMTDLRINKASILYKKVPDTDVDFNLSEDLSDSNLKLFNKDFLNDYHFVINGEVELDAIDSIKTVSSAFKINTLNAFIAMNFDKNDRKLALMLNTSDLINKNFTVNNFNLSAEIPLHSGVNKEYGLAISGDFKIGYDNGDSLEFFAGGKIYTNGFYLSGGLKNNYFLKLNDTLSLSEIGVVIGYDKITQYGIGFQGRVISNDKDSSASLFAATHFNIIGKFIKLNLFSIAIAPTNNEPVVLSTLISNMFGVPKILMHPYLHAIAVGDLLIKKSSTNTLTYNNSNKSLTKKNQLDIINYFNENVADTLKIKINQDEIDNVAIIPLETEVIHQYNYLITDHNKKIHYKVDYKGNILLNSQLYFCISETTIGTQKYNPGMFAAALISVLGQEIKLMLKLESSGCIEAYASMSPVDFYGILKISASKEQAKAINSNKYLTNSNGLFTQVINSQGLTESVGGPEIYLRVGNPSTSNANSLFEFKTHGQVSLLHIFKADAFVYLGETTKIKFDVQLLNFNIIVNYESSLNKNDNTLDTKFSFTFEVSQFSSFIKEIQDSITAGVKNFSEKMDSAKRALNEAKRRREQEIANKRREAEAYYNSLSWWRKRLYNIGSAISSFVNQVQSIAYSVANVVLDVVKGAVEVGGYLFNKLLDAANALVSLLGKVFSLNRLHIASSMNIALNQREFNANLTAGYDFTIFTRNMSGEFNFNCNFKLGNESNFIGTLKNALKQTLLDKVYSTSEYKSYSEGKDELDPIQYNNPTSQDILELKNEAEEILSKHLKIEEYRNYIADIFNNPANFESLDNYLETSTDEYKDLIQDIINGNFKNPTSELNALLTTLNSDEFREHYNEMNEIVQNDPTFNDDIKDSFNSLDIMFADLDAKINNANEARIAINMERSKRRNELRIVNDEIEKEIQKVEFNAIVSQLKRGIPFEFVTEDAIIDFSNFILQIEDPNLLKLAIEEIERNYSKLNN